MSSEKRHYIAVLPDGREFDHEIAAETKNEEWNRTTLRGIAEKTAVEAGLTSPRTGETHAVSVRIDRLIIQGRKLIRQHATTILVYPPLAPMTEDDYERELAESLEGLPPEFATFVSEKAYDDGHAYGYEEVVSLARNMACNLKPAIEKYNKRLNSEQGFSP